MHRPTPRLSAVLSLALALGLTFCVSGCSTQALAYKQSPVCKQSQQKYEAYKKARKQAHGDKNDALKAMREDYEATQRACAESVKTLQENANPDPAGQPPRY